MKQEPTTMRIAVDRYIGQVWYNNFAELVESFASGKEYNHLDTFIGAIVHYNVCYRDILRAQGIDGVLAALFEQAPDFRKEDAAIKRLIQSAERWGPLGDFDMQCMETTDAFSVFGHRLNGLDEVRRSVEINQRTNRYTSKARKYKKIHGLHILCYYEPYPVFDSYDLGDDREYCNYYFLPRPFTDKDLAYLDEIPGHGNNEKFNERLTHVGEMPLLYYRGDGPSMLLITPKLQ